MARRNYFFYPGLVFWLLALLAWSINATPWALAAAGMALISFIIHGLQRQVVSMFGKNKTSATPTPASPAPAATPAPAAAAVVPPAAVERSAFSAAEDKPANTVIASGVRFVGNLAGSGQIYIYGEVEGNIDAGEGLVKVMRNGRVKGDIQGRELIIDGNVHGECQAENISIEEHGNINGALVYAALTVKKGGLFVGKTALLDIPQPKTNVIGFHADSPALPEPEAASATAEPAPAATPRKQG